MVGRIQADVPEPTSDHRDVDSGGDQLDASGVAKRVRVHAFFCSDGNSFAAARTYCASLNRTPAAPSVRLTV